jgi:hypothetical protein
LIRLREDNPDIGMAVSDLSRLECRVRPLRDGQHDLLARYYAFFSADDLTIIPLSPKIVDLATSIRARTGLRTPECLAGGLLPESSTILPLRHQRCGFRA